MKRRTYTLIGVAVFVCALLAYAPAATLYGWLAPKNNPADVELYGVQGTVAQGQLSGVFIKGHPALAKLRWQLNPWWLLLARASFHVQGGGEQAVLDGHVSFAPFNGIRLSDLRAAMKVKPLLTAIGQPYLPLDGQAALDLKSLKLRNNQLRSADGRVTIHGLAWTLAKDPLPLGDYEAVVTTEASDVIAKINSTSGPLELSGTAKLSQDQSYEILAQFKPKADAPPLVVNLVSSSGAPDAQGWYHFTLHGKLQ
ncbi:MAG: type II secretion system protein N [Stenotrophobium sp.]